ncbi:MAG: clostripain-related cysteine peptidase [Candidatus Eremiobacterota bacterium]
MIEIKNTPYIYTKSSEYKKPPETEGEKDSFSSSGPEEKEWTFLVYLNGRGKNDKLAFYKLKDLERTGSDENINIVAEVTRNRHFIDRLTGDWEGTKRYYVTENKHPKTGQIAHLFVPFHTRTVKSPVIEEMSARDETVPESLKDFLSWGMKNYPAKHYGVIVSSSGENVDGIMKYKEEKLTIPEFGEALRKVEKETGKHIDLMVLEGGNSASIEVASEIADSVDYLVASEGRLKGTKIPFKKSIDTVKQGIKEKGTITAEQAGKAFVYESGNQKIASLASPTMSLLDLHKTEEVNKMLGEFSAELGKYPDKEMMRRLVKLSQQFHGKGKKDFVDLRDFTQYVLKATEKTNLSLAEKARNLDKSLEEMVKANFYVGQDVDKAKGVAIYAPVKKLSLSRHILDDVYPELKLAKETEWLTFIQDLAKDKKLYAFLKSRGVSHEDIDFLDKCWYNICEITKGAVGIGSIGAAITVFKSLMNGTLAGAPGLAIGVGMGLIQTAYGVKEAYYKLSDEELEKKLPAAEPIYKATQGAVITSVLALPGNVIDKAGEGIVTGIAALGGIFQAFKNSYEIYDAVRDKNLINKGEKITEEVLDAVKGLAVIAVTMGIVFGAGAGITTVAGLVAAGIPVAKKIFSALITLKYMRDDEKADSRSFDEKMEKILTLSTESPRYYIPPIVKNIEDKTGII